MASPSKKAFFGDLAFDVCKEVYEPAEDTFLFADNLHVKTGATVLDMGTGTGILAVLAAKNAATVVAIDINPYAARCAKQNAKQNRISNAYFIQGDLFSPLKPFAMFDLILFNSPYLPSEPNEQQTWLGRAWSGGESGREVIDRFIPKAHEHLAESGQVLLLQSNLAGTEATAAKFESVGMKAEVVEQKNLPFFEQLILFKARL
jgi:release factor glutamine methyltransferase